MSRILGDLGKALADAKLALAHAEATGELRRIAIAQARLAHVLQWRGDYAEADRLFAEANSSELPDRLRATMHEHAGRSCYDQGRYIEACNHFERALDLRKVDDPELIARTELALDAVFRGSPRTAGGRTRAAGTRSCSCAARRAGVRRDGPALGVHRRGRRPRGRPPGTPTRSRSGTAVAWVRRPGRADLGADRRDRAAR